MCVAISLLPTVWSQVDTKVKKLHDSVKKFADAQQAYAQAGSELAHNFLDL